MLSAELTRFIFKDSNYNKPFFSTYFKASLLVLYIFGFVFHKPWNRSCIRCTCEEDSYTLLENSDTDSESSISRHTSQSYYEIIELPTADEADDDFDKCKESLILHKKTFVFRRCEKIRQILKNLRDSITARFDKRVNCANVAHQRGSRATRTPNSSQRRKIDPCRKGTFLSKFKNSVLDCFSLRVAFFPWPVLVPVVAIVDPRPSCQHHLLNLWPLHPYLVLHFSDSTPGSLLLYEVHFYRHFNWRHCANFFVKNSKRFYRRCTNGGRRLGPG